MRGEVVYFSEIIFLTVCACYTEVLFQFEQDFFLNKKIFPLNSVFYMLQRGSIFTLNM